jgi:hypothetical protein
MLGISYQVGRVLDSQEDPCSKTLIKSSMCVNDIKLTLCCEALLEASCTVGSSVYHLILNVIISYDKLPHRSYIWKRVEEQTHIQHFNHVTTVYSLVAVSS